MTEQEKMRKEQNVQALTKHLRCLYHFQKLARCIQEDPFQEIPETAESVNELCLLADDCEKDIINIEQKLKELEGRNENE